MSYTNHHIIVLILGFPTIQLRSIGNSLEIHRRLFHCRPREDEATAGEAGGVSSYTVGWIITILGIALLREAIRQGGQGYDSRHAVAWFVVFVGMVILGGIVGGLIASSL
jgi:hypothetical protein